MAYILIFGPVALAIIYSVAIIIWLGRQSAGSEAMQKISRAIQEGAAAFLNRQYATVAYAASPLFIVIYLLLGGNTALGFAVGAFASALAGYIGMNVAVRSNARTAHAAHKGVAPALTLAFRAGSVTGFFVVALALCAVAVFYYGTNNNAGALIGLGFGASLISIFARLGGGIFTKAADVGADLVGKIEAGIPEDDPRNPGVIADGVGDNVGDVAGMAADVFETYAVSMIAALLLVRGPLPLVVGGVSLVASLIGVLFVSVGRKGDIMGALYKGLIASLALSAIFFYFTLTSVYHTDLAVLYALFIGLAVTALMVFVTDYYTSKKFRPVRSIAYASESGHGTNIIMGLAVGMESTFVPILIISAGIFATLISGLMAGPAVSLYGSPTVSPVTAALCASEPLPP